MNDGWIADTRGLDKVLIWKSGEDREKLPISAYRSHKPLDRCIKAHTKQLLPSFKKKISVLLRRANDLSRVNKWTIFHTKMALLSVLLGA